MYAMYEVDLSGNGLSGTSTFCSSCSAWYTIVYQPINLSKKLLTGQLVLVQVEDRQVSAEDEFRGNVACAARRSFLDVGTLVYQQMNLSKKVLTGQFVVVQKELLQCCAEAEFRGNVACAARRSFLVRGTLVYRSINLSEKGLTGQLVAVQIEALHSRAQPELRRNVACAARRSFLIVGTLVYQTGLDEQKICLPVSLLSARERTVIALQRPSSVGIRPEIKLIERIISRSLLVLQYTKPINLSKKVRTGQFIEAEREAFQCRAEAEFRRNVACAASRSFLDVGTLVYR
jgi:hypothetical protein